ncbi:MAG: hypothetical protein BWY92_00414 [Firmicutes bacterium ADurb.BinA052]|nr:MAG: hypothetical protein BWY92_00414 [Firmicutes bacterium ADurb.BinA052]
MGAKRRGGGAARALTICLLLVVAITEAALPSLIEQRVERAVASGFTAVESVEARAQAFPAVRMLFGHFDRLNVSIRRARLAGFSVDSIEVRSAGAQVPLSDFAPGSKRWARALGDAELTVSVLDADINDYLKTRDDALRMFSVSFREGVAELNGAISFAGINVSVSSQGRLVIEDHARLVYAVDKLSVERSQLPAFLLDAFEGRVELGVDLSTLPFGAVLEGIRVGAGVAHMYGRTVKGG